MTYPPIKHGTRVRTTHRKGTVEDEARNWEPPAILERRWGVSGVVGRHSDSHGLCYEVTHDDKTMAWYDAEELEAMPPLTTTVTWWEGLLKDEAAMMRWLKKLQVTEYGGYTGNLEANERWNPENDGRVASFLKKTADDELRHSGLLVKIIHDRGEHLADQNAMSSFYWDEMDKGIVSLKTCCAVFYFGEQLASDRFEVLLDHPKRPPQDTGRHRRVLAHRSARRDLSRARLSRTRGRERHRRYARPPHARRRRTSRTKDMNTAEKFGTWCKLTCFGGSDKGECPCDSPNDCQLTTHPQFPKYRKMATDRMMRYIRATLPPLAHLLLRKDDP